MKESERNVQMGSEERSVYLDDRLPMEAPAKEFVPGPYYKNIEEVIPELGEAGHDETDLGGNAEGQGRPPGGVDRRDFMRLFSISSLAASAGCVRRPIETVVPYVDQPIDQVPGEAIYYATVEDSGSGCGILVKVREGRPVKIKGNPKHPLSQGGSTALVESSLQSLYHPDRRQHPQMRWGKNNINQVDWEEIFLSLGQACASTTKIGILTRGSTGHRATFFKKVLNRLGAPEENLYTFESQTLYASMAKAYELAFGFSGMPRTSLRDTRLIVGIGAEFLDIGVSPVYEQKGWSHGHTYRNGHMGELIQFESRLTLTGSKATTRHVISPGDELGVTLLLVEALLRHPSSRGAKEEKKLIREVIEAQGPLLKQTLDSLGVEKGIFQELAEKLLNGKDLNRSVVLVGQSGSNDERGTLVQLAGIMANVLIGSYEGNSKSTLNIKKGWLNSPVNPGDVARFLRDGADLDVLFVIDCNPAFTLPETSGIKEVLKSVDHVVSIQPMPCETDRYAHYILPGHHFLESWGDEESVAGFWSTRQPVVRPLTQSRQAEDILLWTLAKAGKPLPYREYRDFLREQWRSIYQLAGVTVDFDTFFSAVLRRGFVGKLQSQAKPTLKSILSHFKNIPPLNQGLRLVAHLDNRLRDGEGADRPVLQEVGDGLTTIAWDTWVGISPVTAKKLGLKYNDVVKVSTSVGSVEGAVFPFPGLHEDTIAIPRGNGRESGLSRVSEGVGFDPQRILSKAFDGLSGHPVTSGQSVTIEKTGRKYRLAAMQKHNDIANRSDIIKVVDEVTARENQGKKKDLDTAPDIYPKLEQGDHRWGMAIDLNRCSGCSACMVSCSLENNIPQVGREQVLLGREMHWIRTDRYFSGPVENPTVTFQPVMCQHCNHAPCEAVCPVYATSHDPEGMNLQTYNRCVGTRYCANACPYKVRRFNWWTHKWNVMGDRPMDRNPRALNPDVTVRTRGIMEKCSFCYQRIRDVKHAAKEDGRKIKDGEIKTACEEACPTNAIVFGDLSDKRSGVSQSRTDHRAYLMLGGDPEHQHFGIKTFPNVSYLAKVEKAKAGEKKDSNKKEHG